MLAILLINRFHAVLNFNNLLLIPWGLLIRQASNAESESGYLKSKVYKFINNFSKFRNVSLKIDSSDYMIKVGLFLAHKGKPQIKK